MVSKRNNNPLITVVVPIYNVADYLPRCLDSILAQTFKNLEIILVNDGSTDNSKSICEDYAKKDKRIIIVNKKNGGLSDARNAGIVIARGAYITFIDSDDYVDSDYVAFLYDSISKYDSGISVCGHTSVYPKTDSKILSASNHKMKMDPKTALRHILRQDLAGLGVSACAKMYKTELFSDRLYPKGRLFEDTAFTYLLVDKCSSISINLKSKYNYVMRDDSIVRSAFSDKKLDLIKSTEEMCGYISNKYPDLKKDCKSRLLYSYLSTLAQLTKCSPRRKDIEKKLTRGIRRLAFPTVFYKSTPKRDKIGALCATLGFRAYKSSWGFYSKITGRS